MNRTFIKGFLAGNALLIAGLAATAIGIKTKVINPIKKKKNKLKWVENEQPENGLPLKLTNIIRKT